MQILEVTVYICLGSTGDPIRQHMAKLSQESITEANKFTENILSRENIYRVEKKEWHIQGTTNTFIDKAEFKAKEKEVL